MDVADTCKRANQLENARKWYKKVNKLQPLAAQGWIEYAKMEEEKGGMLASLVKIKYE